MKEEFKISFSQYSTYKQCQHKWYLSYILKLPGDVSEELIFGSCLHTVIEEMLGNPLFQKMYKTDATTTVRNIFKSALKEELLKVKDIVFLTKFKNGSLGNIFVAQAVKVLDALHFFKLFHEWEIVEIEKKLDGVTVAENDTVKILFKGVIDLVLKNKVTNEYLILDWKSSGKPWDINKKLNDKDFIAQLYLYKHFYSTIYNIPFDLIHTAFYNLPRMSPMKQEFFPIDITAEATEIFLKEFSEVCFKMVEHKKTQKDFIKVKMVTTKNYCYRCKFNTIELCNNTDPFQTISL